MKKTKLGWECWAVFIGLIVFIILMVVNCQETVRAGGTLAPQAYLPLILKTVGTFVSPLPTPFLSPVSYLPVIMKNLPDTVRYVPPVGPPPTPTPVPIGYLMALTFENNTDGTVCYGVEGIKAEEECMDSGKRVFYGSIPMGFNYRFWGKGCTEGYPITGETDLIYRSGTIAFHCDDFFVDGEWKPLIWAKMYEFGGG